jgi:hypothetical protein
MKGRTGSATIRIGPSTGRSNNPPTAFNALLSATARRIGMTGASNMQ